MTRTLHDHLEEDHMTEDQDNAGEVVAAAVRVALTAAGRLAEQAARRREANLREAERDSAARVSTLQSQVAAERELALRSVRDVVQRRDAATVDEVMRAWEQARSWDDPTMGDERFQLEGLIRERFGVDARTVDTERSTSDQATASAIVNGDIEMQAGDERQRGWHQGRVPALQAELVAAGATDEAAHARALSAESHPTQPALAAQNLRGTAAAKRPINRRGRVTEVQGLTK